MQYLRVAVVVAGASIVARVWNLNPSHAIAGDPAHAMASHALASVVWFPRVHWLPLLETLSLATLGPLLAHRLNIRSGALLIPLGVRPDA